jgi:transcriptional regulator with XRE-family HTH domain
MNIYGGLAQAETRGDVMSALNNKLAARIRLLRQQKNWTQARLGRAAGLTFKFVGQIERGEVSPTLNSLEKLARALQLTVADLLTFGNGSAAKTRRLIVLPCSPADLKIIRSGLRILTRLFGNDKID